MDHLRSTLKPGQYVEQCRESRDKQLNLGLNLCFRPTRNTRG